MPHAKKHHFSEEQVAAIIANLSANQVHGALRAYARSLLISRLSKRRRFGHRKWQPGMRGRGPTETRERAE